MTLLSRYVYEDFLELVSSWNDLIQTLKGALQELSRDRLCVIGTSFLMSLTAF